MYTLWSQRREGSILLDFHGGISFVSRLILTVSCLIWQQNLSTFGELRSQTPFKSFDKSSYQNENIIVYILITRFDSFLILVHTLTTHQNRMP